MSFSVMAGIEYNIGLTPSFLFINTTDTLSTVLTTGYLTGDTTVTYTNNLMAFVTTTDKGAVLLAISVSGSVISLVMPPINGLITSPPASQSSSLAVGTAYQNTLGYDVMLTVYLNITSALAANILLGVGPSNTPTQQTLISGLTLSVLGIIPVNIYIPAGYYAKLSTSGTIVMAISGQIAMPI